ncbi:LysR family transcriptional regulator [Pseudomonas putida]|nr:LysR family transcriptional regulator [Pseudomonas putida]
MKLTEYGQRMLGHARQALESVRRARQEIEDMKGQVVSEITVGVTPVTALLAPLKQVLLAFQQKHPEVMLRILEMRPTQLLQHLRDGLLDFALTSQLPASTVGLDWQPLCRLAGVVVVRKDHPLRHVKSLRQLQQATWISVDPLSDAQSQFNQLFQGSALARPRQVIECTAMNLAVKMLIDSDAVMPISEPALGHDLVGLSDMSKHFHTVQVQEPIPDYFINLVCINRSYLTTTASLLHGLLRQSLETATQQP